MDNYDRLIQTCGVNLDTLQKLNISADVAPKCLPQDHGGKSSHRDLTHVQVDS